MPQLIAVFGPIVLWLIVCTVNGVRDTSDTHGV